MNKISWSKLCGFTNDTLDALLGTRNCCGVGLIFLFSWSRYQATLIELLMAVDDWFIITPIKYIFHQEYALEFDSLRHSRLKTLYAAVVLSVVRKRVQRIDGRQVVKRSTRSETQPRMWSAMATTLLSQKNVLCFLNHIHDSGSNASGHSVCHMACSKSAVRVVV